MRWISYPMKLSPAYVAYPWGGENLGPLYGRALPGDHMGESWELSAEGKGISTVANGPFVGQTLQQLWQAYPEQLAGASQPGAGDAFPLLIKLIDAADDLSVQVHPDDAYAAAHERDRGGRGKTEMWVVLRAEPGARMVLGLKPGVDRARLAAALEDGAVEDCLYSAPVQAGEAYFIPAGLVHAIGRGIVVYEVQQNCDITYRLFDYNRPGLDGKPRPLHIAQSLDAAHYDLPPARPAQGERTRREGALIEQLSRNPYFELSRITLDGEADLETEGRLCALTVTQGVVRVGEVEARPGDTVLLPGALPGVRLSGQGALLSACAR